MKAPIVPIVTAITVLAAAAYLITATRPVKKALGTPKLVRLANIEGVETDAALAPDGVRCAVISSGHLWLLQTNDGTARRLATTPQEEGFPAWTSDGRTLSFTRGGDTFVASMDDLQSPRPFKPNATAMNWSGDGKVAFVRERALWLANADGSQERPLLQADLNPDVAIERPRFSPDSKQIAFVKNTLNLRGEVWVVNLANAESRPVAADRPAENPMDAGWIMDGRELVYLTNRSGAYALWRINLAGNVIEPLTVTLDTAPLGRLGISTWKDRIVVPRQFLDSDIVLSNGAKLAETADVEFEPAVSPDGQLIAYTIQKDTRFEIWTMGIDGRNPTFRALGREPRFSPSGFQIVYTNTDPSGNEDIWRTDLRNSAAESLTDAQEIDLQADWSPDGRTIAFASARGGPVSVWSTPADGGKRLRLNDGGAYPRFFDRGQSILYWNRNAFWTMDANGGNKRRVRDGGLNPVPAVWTAQGAEYYADAEINGGRQIWPGFDILPDGRRVIAPINIHETSLWAVDLTYFLK